MEKPYYTMPELANIMGMTTKGFHNTIHSETCPFPTYKLGKRRVADKEVVRQFFEQKRLEGLREITTKS